MRDSEKIVSTMYLLNSFQGSGVSFVVVALFVELVRVSDVAAVV